MITWKLKSRSISSNKKWQPVVSIFNLAQTKEIELLTIALVCLFGSTTMLPRQAILLTKKVWWPWLALKATQLSSLLLNLWLVVGVTFRGKIKLLNLFFLSLFVTPWSALLALTTDSIISRFIPEITPCIDWLSISKTASTSILSTSRYCWIIGDNNSRPFAPKRIDIHMYVFNILYL